MSSKAVRTIQKMTVGMAIRSVLLDIGEDTLEQVHKKLAEYYDCDTFDCFDNPEYLKRVLKELYGSYYKQIVQDIIRNLGNDASGNYVEEFLAVLTKK